MPRKDTRKKNKKLVLAAIIILVLLTVFGFVGYGLLNRDTRIALAGELKNTDGGLIDLSDEEDVAKKVNDIIDSKKNVVFYISTLACTEKTSEFREFVKDYLAEKGISFYAFTSYNVKSTKIYEQVKYYPTVVIVSDGEIKHYLRFDSDEDKEIYESKDAFIKWFEDKVIF